MDWLIAVCPCKASKPDNERDPFCSMVSIVTFTCQPMTTMFIFCMVIIAHDYYGSSQLISARQKMFPL